LSSGALRLEGLDEGRKPGHVGEQGSDLAPLAAEIHGLGIARQPLGQIGGEIP
jgi:hypothetical protein